MAQELIQYLSLPEHSLIDSLRKRLGYYRLVNVVRRNYYYGETHVKNLRISVPPQFEGIKESVGWAKVGVDAINDRLVLRGWTRGEAFGLNDVFDDNNLEEEATLANRDALVYGVGYVLVSNGDDDEPETLITAESPNYIVAKYDLRKRRPVAALHLLDTDEYEDARGTLFTETETIPFRVKGNKYIGDGPRVEHGFGRVPVAMIINNRESGSSRGHSEITVPMMSLIDNVNRTLLGAEMAREFYAAPLRWAMGAPAEFFTDPKTGQRVNPLTSSMSGMWILPGIKDKDGKFYNPTSVGQFQANSPTALTELIRTNAQLFAAEAVIPEYYLGFNTTNPTSADAIRSGEARLIKRAHQKITTFSRAWSDVARLTMLSRGEIPEGFTGIRPSWDDVATISPSAAADRATKLVSQGILQPTSELVLKELGLSRDEIAQVQAEAVQAQSMGIIGTLRQNAANLPDLGTARDTGGE